MLTSPVQDSVVDATRALRPTLLAHRDEAERLGRLHPKVVEAAGAAGMFRLLAPRRVGGLQLPIPSQYAVWEELARTDSTVAWCSWNCSPAGYFSAFLAPDAAAAVFADPDACFGYSAVSGAIGNVVSGGVRVSGRWPVVSGAEVSSWFVLACVIDTGDAGPRVPAMLFVPADDVDVHDTWRAGAFRATGSHAVSVSDAHVPDGFIWRLGDAPVVNEPPYRLGPAVLFTPAAGAIALGMAASALAALREVTQRVAASTRAAIRQRRHVQEAAADASVAVAAARRQLYASAEALWNAVEHGIDTVPARADLWAAGFHAVETSLAAIDRVHRAAGIDAIVAGSTLDRALREAHAIGPYIDAFRSLQAAAGRVILGLEPDHPLF